MGRFFFNKMADNRQLPDRNRRMGRLRIRNRRNPYGYRGLVKPVAITPPRRPPKNPPNKGAPNKKGLLAGNPAGPKFPRYNA